MAKLERTFTSFFVLSVLCLAAGVYLAASSATTDPLANSPGGLIAGATLIALGLAALYMAVRSFLHHRAVVLHITRKHRAGRRVRVKKRRSVPQQELPPQGASQHEDGAEGES